MKYFSWVIFLFSGFVDAGPITIHADIVELDSASPQLLYKFERITDIQNGVGSSTRRYTDPASKLAVEERVFYENGKCHRVELKQFQLETEGKVEVRNGRIHFSYGKKNQLSESDEEWVENFLCADQITTYILNHWDSLMKGETRAIRLPAIERRETVGFKLFQDEEISIRGQNYTVIQMKPSSFIIAALVKPIRFLFQKTGEHSLYQVRGRTVPKQKNGDSWKDLDAVMQF